MARRVKRAKKKSRAERKIISDRVLGEREPAFTPGREMGRVEYGNALTWYNYTRDAKQARRYLIEYLQGANRKSEAGRLRRVPDQRVPLTAAWASRLLTRGATLARESRDFLERALAEALTHERVEEPEEKKRSAGPTIHERMNEKVSEVVGELNGLIDDGEREFPMYEYFQTVQFPPKLAMGVARAFRGAHQELSEALGDDPDEQLVEAYARYDRTGLETLRDALGCIIDETERYATNTKRLRAPRKKKPVSIEKKLARFVYMKQDPDLRIASVDPARLIGASEAWLYHTRYHTLTVLRAAQHDATGLDVKGRKIVNTDPNDSHTYRTGRGKKQRERVEAAHELSRAALKKMAQGLKATNRPQDRVNEHTLIVRVF